MKQENPVLDGKGHYTRTYVCEMGDVSRRDQVGTGIRPTAITVVM
jgi:hypothetical protein